MTRMTVWVVLLTVFLITLTRYMFICVWKSMRTMDDDLLARTATVLVVSVSVFWGVHRSWKNLVFSSDMAISRRV